MPIYFHSCSGKLSSRTISMQRQLSPIVYWAKHMFGAFHRQKRPYQRPIILVSTRRSGSTLLMEMIYSQPNVTYSDQPLDLWHYQPYRRRLPQPTASQFVGLTSAEIGQLAHYFNDLFAGRIRVYSPWRLNAPSYSWSVNRVVAKLVSAHALINWFATEFDAHVVYLVRHPIPTALSILHKGWGNVAHAFLDNNEFATSHLSAEQQAKCHQIATNGTPLEQYVLEWCLLNLIPLQSRTHDHFLTITYEELLMRPQPTTQLLADYCQLPDPDLMVRQSQRASRNTVTKSAEMIRDNAPNVLLSRWQTQVTPDETQRAMSIVSDLLNDAPYQADSPFPAPSLCNFGPLQAV